MPSVTREGGINDAAGRLRAGGVVALPTETVYGLAADAANPAAVRRIYAIKGRPADHPLIVHLPQAADLERYAAGDLRTARILAERYWPGPLTIVLPKSGIVSGDVTGGQPTVALRVVDHPLTQAILARFGSAVAAPSANRFGRVSPTTAQHVRDDLGDDVDLVVDGGPARVGIESTIVDLSGNIPAVLRLGSIGVAELSAVLGTAVETRVGGTVRAPGTLESHYAPRSPLVLIEQNTLEAELKRRAAAGERAGVLVLPDGAAAAARALYAALRDLDRGDYDVLLAILPPDTPSNAAVRDRLRRAAASTTARSVNAELGNEQQTGSK